MAALGFPTLNDGVVALRPWRSDDAGELVAALDDPDVSLWIPVIPYPYRLEEARSFFDLVARESSAGRMVAGAIVDHADTRLLGGIGLSSISRPNASAEVGYWVAAAERSRGVATRATALLVDWGFAELGLDRLGLLADVDNVASRHIARKLGFVEEGVLRSYLMTRRGRRDTVMYGRLATDTREGPLSALPARVSLVTLGARDIERMRAFFEGVGWPLWTVAEDGFTGYLTGGAMLALYPVESLAELSGAGKTDKGEWSGVTLSVNVEERALVDAALEAARAAGADIVVEAVDADFGGRSGCFADPEGNRFEVAWMPGSSFDAGGALVVPRAEEG